VDHGFTAERPKALWMADRSYELTWSGMVYVCFIVDVLSRKIVGWRAADRMRTDIVLDALEMARFNHVSSVTTPASASANALTRSTQFLQSAVLVIPMTEMMVNALAEATSSLYKTELIRGPDHQGRWRNAEQVELATLGWVHWFNTGPGSQLPRRRVTRRVRSSVLCCQQDQPTPGWNPSSRATQNPWPFTLVDERGGWFAAGSTQRGRLY
jgi:transposase InsO family protein